MEKQRDEIRERLMKSGHVHVGRVRERRSQAIEQRMRRFVRHDVVTERGGDQAVLQREAGRVLARREVPEREVSGFAAVSRIGSLEPEGTHDQSQRSIVCRRGRPGNLAAERLPERCIRQAADGVDHLQMKEPVGRRW